MLTSFLIPILSLKKFEPLREQIKHSGTPGSHSGSEASRHVALSPQPLGPHLLGCVVIWPRGSLRLSEGCGVKAGTEKGGPTEAWLGRAVEGEARCMWSLQRQDCGKQGRLLLWQELHFALVPSGAKLLWHRHCWLVPRNRVACLGM